MASILWSLASTIIVTFPNIQENLLCQIMPSDKNCMNLQAITSELQSNLRHVISCEDRRNVYGAAFLLDKVNDFLLGYISFYNEQQSGYPAMHFSADEIAELESMLRFLSRDFFPMAHTSVPLGALQITDREKINSELQSVRYLHRHMEHLLREASQIASDCKEAEIRLNSLANP